MDSSKNGYYDLMQNMITVRGFSSHDSMEEAKILSYPGLLPNLYCITKTGQVYSVINDSSMGVGSKYFKAKVNLLKYGDETLHGPNPYMPGTPYFDKRVKKEYNYI